MTFNKKILTVLMVICFISIFINVSTLLAADVKLAYMDSQKVLAEYKEYQEANKEYEKVMAVWSQEAEDRKREITDLRDQVEKQSMLWTEERKDEMQRKLKQREEDYKRFVDEIFGEQGKGVQKQVELAQPIYDKINLLLDKIAKEDGYTMVLDTINGNVLYADKSLDITQRIIDVLNKEYEKTGGTGAKSTSGTTGTTGTSQPPKPQDTQKGD